MGLIERWGSGTTRIASELQASGYPLPVFKSESGRFRLTFYQNSQVDKLLQKMGFTQRQRKAIAYVKEHGSISNSEDKSITGVSKSTATLELKELVIKNIFVVKGSKGKGVVYRFKQP